MSLVRIFVAMECVCQDLSSVAKKDDKEGEIFLEFREIELRRFALWNICLLMQNFPVFYEDLCVPTLCDTVKEM